MCALFALSMGNLETANETFKRISHNDDIKNKYCIENKIPLLRISYKDYGCIPDILKRHVPVRGA